MSTLEIKDLYAHVETKDGIKPILKRREPDRQLR